MTVHELFDNINYEYNLAKSVTDRYKIHGVYRDRQHGISSILEDLLAKALYQNLKRIFPEIPFCCMVDYRINIGHEVMYPDIAIIVEKDEKDPILVSYIDVKSDFGYKREYHKVFPVIAQKVKNMRANRTTGTLNFARKPVIAQNNIKWRTVVISDKVMSKKNKYLFEAQANSFTDYMDLYFLSGGKHPNTKDRVGIKIYAQIWEKLITDLHQDFSNGLFSVC